MSGGELDRGFLVSAIRAAATTQRTYPLARGSDAETFDRRPCLPTDPAAMRYNPTGALRCRLADGSGYPHTERYVRLFEMAFVEVHGCLPRVMARDAINEKTMAARMELVATRLEQANGETTPCPHCHGRGRVPVVTDRANRGGSQTGGRDGWRP